MFVFKCVGNTELTEAQYMAVIGAKTAMLFQAAAHSAAVLATNDAHQIEALRDARSHDEAANGTPMSFESREKA